MLAREQDFKGGDDSLLREDIPWVLPSILRGKKEFEWDVVKCFEEIESIDGIWLCPNP